MASGLPAVLGQAVQAASTWSASLRLPVVHRARREADELGARELEDPETLSALVQEGEQKLSTGDGRQVTISALLTIFPTVVGAAPPTIGMADELTLPSGYSAPILKVADGLANPYTGEPYARIVWLA